MPTIALHLSRACMALALCCSKAVAVAASSSGALATGAAAGWVST